MALVRRVLPYIALLALAFQVAVHAEVYVNFSTGNDSASGTISNPYLTLRRALYSDDSTIYLAGVTDRAVDCSLNISKSVKIISQGAEMNCQEGILELAGQNNEFSLVGFNSLASLRVTRAMGVTVSNSIFHGIVIENTATPTRISNVSLSGPVRFLFSGSSRPGEVSLFQVRSSHKDKEAFYFENADAQLVDVTCTKVTKCISAKNSTLVARRLAYTVKGGIVGVKGSNSSIEIHDSTFSSLLQAIHVTGSKSTESMSSLRVYSSNFTENGNSGHGGDIGAKNSLVFVKDSKFYHSAAVSGGSIHFEGSQDLVARNNIWFDSAASNGAVALRIIEGKSEFVGNHIDSPYCGQAGFVFRLTRGCFVQNNTYCKVPRAQWPDFVVFPCSTPSADDENCHPVPPVTSTETVVSAITTTGTDTTETSSLSTTGISTTETSTVSTSGISITEISTLATTGTSTTGSTFHTSPWYSAMIITAMVLCLLIIAMLVVVVAKLTVCSKTPQSRLYEPIA